MDDAGAADDGERERRIFEILGGGVGDDGYAYFFGGGARCESLGEEHGIGFHSADVGSESARVNENFHAAPLLAGVGV